MNYAEQQKNPMRHIVGIGVVVLFHVLLIYGLVNGLGSNIIAKLRAPIETKIIQEQKKPPPDVPPPPPPELAAPPPPYIPPPDIQIAAPPQQTNAIQEVTRVAPPAQPFVIAKPAPAVADSGPSSNPVIGSSKPEFPADLEEEGRSGKVTVTCTIDADGRPKNCSLISSQGGSAFGQAVMRWLSSGTALYRPAVRNGAKVAMQTTLNIRFDNPN